MGNWFVFMRRTYPGKSARAPEFRMQETYVDGTLLSSTNEDGTGWQRFLIDLIKITHSIRFSLSSHAWFSFGLLGWLVERFAILQPLRAIERGLNVLTLMDITPAFRFGTMACLSGCFVSQSAFGASEHLPLQHDSETLSKFDIFLNCFLVENIGTLKTN